MLDAVFMEPQRQFYEDNAAYGASPPLRLKWKVWTERGKIRATQR
jgi:hypothetical protein